MPWYGVSSAPGVLCGDTKLNATIRAKSEGQFGFHFSMFLSIALVKYAFCLQLDCVSLVTERATMRPEATFG